MSGFSDYLENALLNHTLRNVSYTPAATIYIGLHTADPTDVTATALANEVSGNAYARQSVAFSAASGGVCSNSGTVTFPTATPSGWGTITHVSLWDASTSGNLLYRGTLTPNVVVTAGVSLVFATSDIDVTHA